MQITVVGCGYVGLVTAACFAEVGHRVSSVDNDAEKIAALNRCEMPIHEDGLGELVKRHRGRRLRFSTSVADAVAESALVFIAVGTPAAEGGEADTSYVEAVAREVSASVDGHGYKVVVEKSTVPVLTRDWIHRVMLRSGANKGAFDVASNPEFLREGTAVTDFLYPDRIVIGAETKRAAALLQEAYRPLLDGSYARREDALCRPTGPWNPPELIRVSAKSAELIKHASNAFLATKISFINAVSNICESVGADIEEVCRGIGSDSRIGSRFLSPGLGYGGSCFPKDLQAFRAVARECGCDFHLLDEVAHINQRQIQLFLRKLRSAVWNVKGKRLAALGLAFKGGTDDVRESPALAVIRALLQEGAFVSVYDPAATERAKSVLAHERLSFASDSYSAMDGASALLILTDWDEFRSLDFAQLRDRLVEPIVVDGRNLYRSDQMRRQGILYWSIGRPPTAATAGPIKKKMVKAYSPSALSPANRRAR